MHFAFSRAACLQLERRKLLMFRLPTETIILALLLAKAAILYHIEWVA
jgi:hypothetical protein